MAKRVNYTQKTLAKLRESGAVVDVCERWVTIPNRPGGGVRKDLFGFIDLIALRNGAIIGIQSTSAACRGDHIAKILANENLGAWLAAGAKLELWTWKRTAHGKSFRYEPRISEITAKP